MSTTDELMAQDGYVPAHKVAAATGRTLPTIHNRIKAGKVPGTQYEGRYWYVDIHGYLAVCELPKESSAYKALRNLASTVRRPKR